jgi:hypothetical protein
VAYFGSYHYTPYSKTGNYFGGTGTLECTREGEQGILLTLFFTPFSHWAKPNWAF